MDVTLLLNQSGGRTVSRESTPASVTGAAPTVPSTALPTPSPERASPQQEKERLSRGRTPWNAGGYSLPLHTEAKFASSAAGTTYRWTSEQPEPETRWTSSAVHSRHGSTDSDMAPRELDLHSRPQLTRTVTLDHRQRPSEFLEKRLPGWNERRGTDEPWNSPRHKFSDSHSSLSSYGSWQSRCHSRISSVTTVNGRSSLADAPIFESKFGEHDGASETERPLSATSRTRLSTTDEAAEMEAPRSPSDAVLNMKAPPRYRPHVESGHPYLRASHLLSSPRLHKRAISAPDFALPSHSLRHGFSVLPPPHHTMAISANGPRGIALMERRNGSEAAETEVTQGRGESGHVAATPACSPPPRLVDDDASTSSGGEVEEPRCMFVNNCDTGSQLRKAISHLFGRNKSCTLKIPRPVWVYYCRKHYQRIRYRNAKTYPANQMDLVKVQIRRLQTWSENNRSRGRGPFIKQWTLSLRKREQNRLESGKGGAMDGGMEDQYASQGGCAVPDWIIHLLGDGYSTDRMLDIAERLHKEIVDGLLTQVPEIEFLPDIVDDDASKPARARRQNSTHSGTHSSAHSASAAASRTPKRKAASHLPHDSAKYADSQYTDNQYADALGYAHHALGDDFDDAGQLVSAMGKRARHDLGNMAYRRSMHPYMTTPAPMPPRAPKVVPKMHYNQALSQVDYDAASHGRFGSQFQHSFTTGSLYANGGMSAPDHHNSDHQHHHQQQQAGRYGSGHESQLTLPPLGMQMAPHASSSSSSSMAKPARFGGHMRSMHQRSASAYTPASRPVAASTRPSSSGNTQQLSRLNGSAYDVASHAHTLQQHPMPDAHWKPQHVVDHQASQYGHAWVPDYGHAFASPAAAAAAAAFQPSSVYGHRQEQRATTSYGVN